MDILLSSIIDLAHSDSAGVKVLSTMSLSAFIDDSLLAIEALIADSTLSSAALISAEAVSDISFFWISATVSYKFRKAKLRFAR